MTSIDLGEVRAWIRERWAAYGQPMALVMSDVRVIDQLVQLFEQHAVTLDQARRVPGLIEDIEVLQSEVEWLARYADELKSGRGDEEYD